MTFISLLILLCTPCEELSTAVSELANRAGLMHLDPSPDGVGTKSAK
jgi:hypothetical protein